MEVQPIFSIGIGKCNVNALLPLARQIFIENKKLFKSAKDNFDTTLRNYSSGFDSAVLNNQPAVNTLKKTIIEKAKLYYANLGFNIDLLVFEIPNLWLNEMQKNSGQDVHVHYGFQLSGCLYVDLPLNSNYIKFYGYPKFNEHTHNLKKNYTQYNSAYATIMPQEGDLFIWESLLQHEVPAAEFEGTRRSIAFDLRIHENKGK